MNAEPDRPDSEEVSSPLDSNLEMSQDSHLEESLDSNTDPSNGYPSNLQPSSFTGTVPFFTAVRELQTRSRSLIGRDTKPSKEPVRLRAELSLSYPATEVAHAETDAAGRVNLLVSFFGLFGPSGTLPRHYTQLAIDRGKVKDWTLRDFLDLFNHRWLSFFYRAWEKHNYPAAFQTSRSIDEDDTVTRILWSLIGFGNDGQRNRLRLQERWLLYFSGLVSDPRPRQTSLRAIVQSYFNVPAAVLQFQGEWLQIPSVDQSRISLGGFGGNSNNCLGADTVVGSRIWNVENRFRMRIGPLERRDFDRFSPMGERLVELVTLVRSYVGVQFEFDVQVVVRRDEVPATTLSGGSQLGWNTWLGDWPFDHHAEDAVFTVDDLQTTH